MVAAPSCLDIEPHPDLIIILPFESTTQTVNSRLYHEGIHSEREQAPPEIRFVAAGSNTAPLWPSGSVQGTDGSKWTENKPRWLTIRGETDGGTKNRTPEVAKGVRDVKSRM